MKSIFTAMMLGIIGNNILAQIPQNGLIAHFDCNGSNGTTSQKNGKTMWPNNYSSNSRTQGKIAPAPAMDRHGQEDSALGFEYTGYHYNLNHVDNYTDNRGLKIKKQITFGCWVLVTGYDQYNMSPLVMGAFGPSKASYAIQGNLYNGNFYALISTNTAENQNLSVNVASEGTSGIEYYRHIMATVSSDDSFKLYYQGRLVAASKLTGDSIKYFNHSNGNPYFSLGADFINNGWNNTGFNGRVDDVLIYDRALTAAEIWNLFNTTKNCKNRSDPRSNHLLRGLSSQQHLLSVADTTLWHNDQCEFEWYKNGNIGMTSKKSSGNTISITQNGNYKVKVIHQASRCWYWTNEISVTDLGNSNRVIEMEQINAALFPNPAENSIQITADQIIDEVGIWGIDGKEKMTGIRIAGMQGAIDISSLPTGVYFVKIKSGNSWSTQRLIKN